MFMYTRAREAQEILKRQDNSSKRFIQEALRVMRIAWEVDTITALSDLAYRN